jgi:myo-inositol-1(or 4)-monophosphatase
MTVNQSIRDSHALVIDVFKGFRDELMSSYGVTHFSLKSDNSQVTELDLKVEHRLREKLAASFPHYGFRGEETGIFGNTDEFWITDPIDGTSSFIRGMPNCTNMAAFIVGNRPVASVIYNFAEDVLYTAFEGEGAYRNGERIHVSTRRNDNAAIDNLNSKIHGHIKSVFAPEGVRVLQPLGACGRSCAYVAEGKLEGVIAISSVGEPHDLAPGLLLVLEAGGEMVSFEEGEWSIFTKNFALTTPTYKHLIDTHKATLMQLVSRQSS